MITYISTIKMIDRPVIATCPLGFSSQGTDVSSFGTSAFGTSGFGAAGFGISGVRPETLAPRPVHELRSERPIQAPAVAAVAQARTYAMAAANGAEIQTQHHQKWASRGLEPWSDPT
ncbi:hypothetical protein [Streptomyces zagrosensis]|uniref:Uncharacterized protein n=1 Tax=Streptomyces zagrosensis TaxID=1042984 RepID=A0A7W9QD50_9ACTN|nr:hypothetical protein [Streptomyces zagrosensis]MBB5936817.1 hypothetical protein [Streptomyces zagrosensis]